MSPMCVSDRVRVLAWYDHAALLAAHRRGVATVGTVVQVEAVAGDVLLSVHVDGVDGTFAFRPGDVEPLSDASRNGSA